jgi:hypothetical protein
MREAAMPPLVAGWRDRVKRRAVALALAALVALPASAAQAQGDAQSCPVGTDPMALAPGQFVWTPEIAPAGPLVIVISLPQQRAYVFRNGVQIGVSAVSTGRPGYETPTGVFRVLEKDVEHYSNLYDDAPMPFMLRLTWGGVAMHAGRDPGRPASHGCIRLPLAFARSLFAVVPLGSQVIITDRSLEPGLRVAPALLGGAPLDLLPGNGDHWSPERAATGPVAVVVSGADKAMSVMRGGAEIGRSRVEIDGEAPLHMHALVLLAPGTPGDGARSGDWLLIELPGGADLPPEQRHAHDIDRVHVPPAFAAKLATVLKPGSTMLISDLPLDVGGSAEVRLTGSPL